ncbi:MAG: hypothetical protein C4295_09575 [Candidatus Fervidibacterota bacterium]
MLGSRTAVRVDGYNGRLPDILFVCKERRHIITDEALWKRPIGWWRFARRAIASRKWRSC